MSFEVKKAIRTSLTQFLHYNPCFRQRPHVRKIFERGGSLEQLNQDGFLNNLLLQTVPVEPSTSTLTHSPSDPGICMDSGSGDDTKTSSSNGQHSSSSSGIADGDSVKTETASNDSGHDEKTVERVGGSDSAHSSTSPSSSSPASSLSGLGHEEAVSLAYIDESRTVHKYIASRGQREKEQEIYEVRPPCLHVTKKIVEVVRV